MKRFLSKLDRHPIWLLPVYVAAYLAAIIPIALRPLWFDELFTYYLAMSKSPHEFWGKVFQVDLNPPLSYFVVAVSLRIFGDSPLAVRLPFIAAFLGASLAVFVMVRRRLGGLFGLTAMVLVWSCGFLYFAAEARPYALLLVFFALAFLFWTDLVPGKGFSARHAMLSGSLALMLLSHCFSVFLVPPFFLGELTRAFREKRIAWADWLALIAPMLLLVTYVPLIGRAESTLFPAVFLPSFERAGMFYLSLLISLGPLVGIPLLVVFALRPTAGARLLLSPGDIVFLCVTMLMPLVIMAYLAYAHVAYFPRYGIGAVIAFSIGSTFLLGWKTGPRPFSAGIAAGLALIGFGIQTYPMLASYFQAAPVQSTEYRRIHPELPFVASSGVTFLQMDHLEPTDFDHRLYYLTDRAAATKYAHATMYEGLPLVAKSFPVRANVTPYQAFVSSHDHFLVFASPHLPEDWLLDKLKDDGAVIQQIAQMTTVYPDTLLYDVQLKHEVPSAHPLN